MKRPMSTTTMMATMIMPLRRGRGASISVSAADSFGFGVGVGSATSLPSYVFSVVHSRAQRTRQAQLGHVVLVKANHILIVSLGHGLLCLAHGQVVAYAVGVTFLRFFESFVGQVHAGLRHLNLFLSSGDVEQGVAHICVNLRLLVTQLRLRGIEVGLRLLGLAAQRKFFKNRHAQGPR